MRTSLLLMFVFLTVSLCFFKSYGQNQSAKAIDEKYDPLYVINSSIIANGSIINLDPKEITGVVVYKRNDEPELLKNLSSTGIVSMTYSKTIASMSFAEAGRQHGVQGTFGVITNGRVLNATQIATLRITPESIGQVQITPAAAGKEAVLIIQLAKQVADSHRRPPETIMIR